MASSLDDYLVQFRNGDGQLLRPVTPPAARTRTSSKGKARAYYLLQDSLPPRAFDLVVGQGYYGARKLAGRNPGRGHLLPDFLLIGAAKCGTTSLFDWLCEHPFIARPTTDGRGRKELLFFDYHFDRGVDWYRAHFPRERDREGFERRHGRPFQTGEATATYLTHHWSPRRVAKVLPNAKLIVTLRNPVDRAYSAFQMSRREQLEACESFESALALEADRLRPAEAQVRADPRYRQPWPPPLGYWSYLQRSRYVEHVERWFECFPRDQFLFLKFEELVEKPQAALDAVYKFLGLPEHRHEQFRKLNAGDYSTMRPETRAALFEYFRPYNERLHALTGMDFGWDR